MMEWQAFLGAGSSLVLLSLGFYKYFQGITESVRKECTARIDALAERESKARHDLAGHAQTLIGKNEQEIKATRDAIDRLRGETVRREDHVALETRLSGKIDKVESKVDGMIKDVAGIPSIARAVDSLVLKLDQLATRGNGSD